MHTRALGGSDDGARGSGSADSKQGLDPWRRCIAVVPAQGGASSPARFAALKPAANAES